MTLTTTQRGYGHDHQQLRKQAARLVATGTARCWRCEQLIDPREPWDLGHDDHDRTIYRGPEHQACNRATRRHTRARTPQQHPGVGVPPKAAEAA